MSVTEGEPDVAGTTRRAEDGAEVRIPTTIDTERFEREFLSALAGTDLGPIARDADMTVSFDGQDWTFDGPETLTAGDYIAVMNNSSTVNAGAAFGWITGDATEEDLIAWNSTDQPPFFEVDGLALAGPEADVRGLIQFTEPGTHYVAGLNGTAGTSTTIGWFEVIEQGMRHTGEQQP